MFGLFFLKKRQRRKGITEKPGPSETPHAISACCRAVSPKPQLSGKNSKRIHNTIPTHTYTLGIGQWTNVGPGDPKAWGWACDERLQGSTNQPKYERYTFSFLLFQDSGLSFCYYYYYYYHYYYCYFISFLSGKTPTFLLFAAVIQGWRTPTNVSWVHALYFLF